jgi:hypothetical protein
MMPKNRNRFFLLAAALVFLILVMVLWNSSPRYTWNETYQGTKEPYDTELLQKLLQERYTLRILDDSLNRFLPQAMEAKACYFFVGDELVLDFGHARQLLDFVESGHTAFISAKDIAPELINMLYEHEESFSVLRSQRAMEVELSLVEISTPNFNLLHQCKDKVCYYPWTYFNLDVHADFLLEDDTILGHIDRQHVNFVRVSYGDGELLLHTTPLAFSNYHLRRREALQYANAVLSYLPDTKTLYWDRYNQLSSLMARELRQPNSGDWRFRGRGPLSYLLSQPALSWAWHLGLGMALMYVLFRAKRRQRIIPVPEPRTNTSLEFVRAIGHLYFLQKDPRRLALHQIQYFFRFVRERYRLSPGDRDEDFIQVLAQKSDVDKEHLDKLLRYIRNVQRSNFLSDNGLLRLHQMQEHFYQHCK